MLGLRAFTKGESRMAEVFDAIDERMAGWIAL
jgi:hypothetical protein